MGGHQAEAEAADAWLQPGGLLEQLPTPLEERIHVLAAGLCRLDRLGAKPATPLLPAFCTLRYVSLAHRALAAAARTAPLLIAFTVEGLPSVHAATAWGDSEYSARLRDARRAAIGAGLEYLASRNVVALHVTAAQDAAPGHSSVWGLLRQHCSTAPRRAFASLRVLLMGSSLPTEFASAGGAFADGPRHRLQLGSLPPHVRHLNLAGACGSRYILLPPLTPLASLALCSTGQNQDLEVPAKPSAQLLAASHVRLVAAGTLRLASRLAPAPPVQASTWVVEQRLHKLLRTVSAGGAARLELTAARRQFGSTTCSCSPGRMVAALQRLAADYGRPDSYLQAHWAAAPAAPCACANRPPHQLAALGVVLLASALTGALAWRKHRRLRQLDQ